AEGGLAAAPETAPAETETTETHAARETEAAANGADLNDDQVAALAADLVKPSARKPPPRQKPTPSLEAPSSRKKKKRRKRKLQGKLLLKPLPGLAPKMLPRWKPAAPPSARSLPRTSRRKLPNMSQLWGGLTNWRKKNQKSRKPKWVPLSRKTRKSFRRRHDPRKSPAKW